MIVITMDPNWIFSAAGTPGANDQYDSYNFGSRFEQEPLVTPPSGIQNKPKRKSAKGRKLMRWDREHSSPRVSATCEH